MENKKEKSNLDMWEKLARPPKEALKQIGGGRLKGMTDVNPQWRMKAMTEVFGPIGEGWKFTIVERWCETIGPEVMCFVTVELFYKVNSSWIGPVVGIGGSKLAIKEKEGVYGSDEGYKMALTDALSVAMKQIGVAADIYAGLWDGSKYIDAPKDKNEAVPIKDIVELARIQWNAKYKLNANRKWFEEAIIKQFGKLPTLKKSIKDILEKIKPDEETERTHIDEITPPPKDIVCTGCRMKYLAMTESCRCDDCGGILAEE